ncbi:MAG: hypothetical protein JNN15_10650 [Blastocatellia bacterium]|nr:hypothetical protein [Blastocatellia bacterium]
MKRVTSLLMILLFGLSTTVFSHNNFQKRELSPEWKVISSLDTEIFRSLAASNRPNTEGALGGNQKGYFSVVFQRSLTFTIVFGLLSEDPTITELGIKAIEYGFKHQNPDGSFPIVPPADLGSKMPSEGDTASAAAFFMSEVGHSLLLLDSSDWFQISTKTESLRSRIQKIKEASNFTLAWLISKEQILMAYDKAATNRLFFDAMALYLTGKSIRNREAILAGYRFLSAALDKQREDGVFIENGGYDSSYQAVSNLRAIFILLNSSEFEMVSQLFERNRLLKPLQKKIAAGIDWEISRVLPSGEISTEGNTRVFPGGEDFLGKEKGVAYVDAIMGFYFYAAISNRSEFREAAEKITNFYIR